MKKMMAMLLCFTVLAGAGCSAKQPEEQETTTPQITQQTEADTQPESEATQPNDYIPAQAPMAAISLPVSVKHEYTENDVLLFTYKCQTISLIIPDSEIERKVILDLQTRLDSFSTAAEDISRQAKADYSAGQDWQNYFYEVLYTPERIDLSVLSLYGENTSWVGGAHPSKNCISSNYDLTTGDVLTLGSILTHEDALAALCELLIEEVAEIKAEKYLFPDYADIIENRFAQNESYNESWYFSRTGLSFYFSPYEIAPYSSGVITLTIPYEKLTGIIEDRYFPAERDVANGSLNIVAEADTDLTSFSQIAEVILDGTGEMLFLYTDRSVQDISIKVGTPDSTGALLTYSTVFAAPILTPGDAVMLQNLWDAQQTVVIEYTSNNKVITATITCDADGTIQITDK